MLDMSPVQKGVIANRWLKCSFLFKLLEEVRIKYAFEFLKLSKLKLEVFEDNERARNLYRRYKFQEVDKKMVNDKKVICMELRNEDR